MRFWKDSSGKWMWNILEAYFLSEVMSFIFSHTDILFDVLTNKTLKIKHYIKKNKDIKNVLKMKLKNVFSEFWKIKCRNSSEQRRKKNRNEDTEKICFMRF